MHYQQLLTGKGSRGTFRALVVGAVWGMLVSRPSTLALGRFQWHPRLVGQTLAALGFLGYAFFFAFFLATAEWIMAGLLFAAVAGVVLLILGFDRTAIIWVLGIPSLFTYINNYAHVVPSFTVGRFLFVVLMGMLTVQVWLRLRHPTRFDVVERLTLAFLSLVFFAMVLRWVTTYGTAWRSDGAIFLTGYVMPLGAYAMARRICWTAAKQKLVLLGTAANGAFLAFVAAAQYFSGTRMFDATFIETQHQNEAFERAVGTFGSSWELGMVTSLSALIAVSLAANTRSLSGKLLGLALAGFSVTGLALSLTRAPWLSFVLGIGIMSLFDAKVRKTVLPFAGLALVAAIALIPVILSSQEISGRVMDVSSLANRVALYVTSVNMIIHNALFGIGLGASSFFQAAPEYMISFGWVQANWMIGVGVPHNEFLFVAVSSGIPALVLYLFIFGRCATENFRVAHGKTATAEDRWLAALCLGMLLAFFFVANTLDPGLGRYASLLLFFFIGMAKAMRDQRASLPEATPAI